MEYAYCLIETHMAKNLRDIITSQIRRYKEMMNTKKELTKVLSLLRIDVAEWFQ